jgi:hypothetical protein
VVSDLFVPPFKRYGFLQDIFLFHKTRIYGGSPSLLVCEYQMCIGIIFELWKGGWGKLLESALAPTSKSQGYMGLKVIYIHVPAYLNLYV